jgi:hypothetical protein
MTTREFLIAKKILDRLHTLDGGQEHHLFVHANIGGLSSKCCRHFVGRPPSADCKSAAQ